MTREGEKRDVREQSEIHVAAAKGSLLPTPSRRSTPISTSTSSSTSISPTSTPAHTFSSSSSSSAAASSDKRRRQRRTMSKLSPSLKALINAPFARPGPHRIAKGAAAAAAVGDLFRGIAGEARGRGVGARAWLAISVSLFCLPGLCDGFSFSFGGGKMDE